jgi:DNA-binding IclR family transcriptional regulator
MSEITSKDSPLERYISILETVAPFGEGLTAIELETALDLPKSTINRLLHALMASGMITAHNARNRSYRLGERILQLLHTSPDTSWLATLAQQPLQKLADSTGQSAFISKFDGSEVRSVTCVVPDTPVRTYVMPGMTMPVNAAATAKAILAFQPEDVLARVLPPSLERFTEKTKTDIDALMSEFAAIRERGYATDLAEHVAGLGTIALPVHVPGAAVAYAVGLTGPYDRIIERNFEGHRLAIAETAGRLGKLLQLRMPTTSD